MKTLAGRMPSWADPSKGFWNPDMIKTTAGTYVVYFAAALKNTNGHPAGNDNKPAQGARCIGTAHGSRPTGPFTVNARPLVCFRQFRPADDMDGDPGQRVRGQGVIGSSPVFVKFGRHAELFLLYKTQANPGAGQPSTIRMVRLADANGTRVLGESHQLLASSTGSFSDTIEAPALIQHGKWFVLFVAHGNFDSCGYSTIWFRSQHIWKWNAAAGTTFMSSATKGTRGLCGPGTADVTGSRVSSQSRIFFNGWVVEKNHVITNTPLSPRIRPIQGKNAARVMYAAVVNWHPGGIPVLGAIQGK